MKEYILYLIDEYWRFDDEHCPACDYDDKQMLIMKIEELLSHQDPPENIEKFVPTKCPKCGKGPIISNWNGTKHKCFYCNHQLN